MRVQEIYREQYSIKDNICMVLLRVDHKYTIAYHKTDTEQYQYTDVFFNAKKEAFIAFDGVMKNAPITNEIK